MVKIYILNKLKKSSKRNKIKGRFTVSIDWINYLSKQHEICQNIMKCKSEIIAKKKDSLMTRNKTMSSVFYNH